MRSFKYQPDNRRQVYLALADQIEGQLRDAYAKRHETAGETQTSLAEKVGVDRSAVHRRLTGRTNMTIETIADMVWALGHCIRVEIFDPDEANTNHRFIRPLDMNFELIERARMIVARSAPNAAEEVNHVKAPWIIAGAANSATSSNVAMSEYKTPIRVTGHVGGEARK